MIVRMGWITNALLASVLMAMFGGCSKSFTAREYPTFYDPNLRTVAVMPFHNETRTRGAGLLVAEDLAAALRVNGTYSVISPRKLRSLLREKKLPELSRTDYAKDAEALRKLGGIQAFITGRVLHESQVAETYSGDYPRLYAWDDAFAEPARYELVEEEEEGEEGGGEDEEGEGFGDEFGEGFGDDFGPFYPYWYRNYPYYYPEYVAEARVALEASLVRVSDGAVLYTTSAPVRGDADLSSRRHIPRANAALDATHQAVAKLVKDFAVVTVEVRLNPHDALRTAVGQRAGPWQFRNTFRPTDQQMYVVLQLPATVARDSFRLTITPRGEPGEVAAARDFVWPAGRTAEALSFSPSAIAAHTGTGKYTVNFYARGRLVMQHDFTMR